MGGVQPAAPIGLDRAMGDQPAGPTPDRDGGGAVKGGSGRSCGG